MPEANPTSEGHPSPIHDAPNASMRRRLAAFFYDSWMLLAIWILTTMAIIAIRDGGEVGGLLYQLVLYLEWMGFYVYFWCVKGQTLGMQVWKIRCVDLNGRSLSFRQGITRFVLATLTLIPFGFGFFWMLVHREHITVYDDMSLSRIVYLGKNPYQSEQNSKQDPEATA
ncbi:MAG: RDD family protein [Pseudomonadota bacterium]